MSDARALELLAIRFECPRIVIEVFAGTELQPIYEHAGDDRVGMFGRLLHESDVAFMQVAHRGHEGDTSEAWAHGAKCADGQRITSEALSGKVTLIDFWGTWCAPCLQQFPELQEVYERFLNLPEVGILALNTGWSGDDPDKIKRFFDLHPYSFPVAHDDNSVSEDFGITSLPHLVLLDKMGKIRMRHTGLMREKGGLKAGLIQRIEELLQEEQDLNQ